MMRCRLTQRQTDYARGGVQKEADPGEWFPSPLTFSLARVPASADWSPSLPNSTLIAPT